MKREQFVNYIDLLREKKVTEVQVTFNSGNETSVRISNIDFDELDPLSDRLMLIDCNRRLLTEISAVESILANNTLSINS